MSRLFNLAIVAAMVAGVAAGGAGRQWLAPDQAAAIADGLYLVTDVFLRLIKMIIAPLVFSTLVAGIAHMGDAASVGRVGVKTLLWFLMASVVSLTLGFVTVGLLQPGAGLQIPLPSTMAQAATAPAPTPQEFLLHLLPQSIFEAMAKNEILPIVVFSVFMGTALASLGTKATDILMLIEQVTAVMLKVTGYVMRLAPVAIFAALAETVMEDGVGVLGAYARFVGGFYFSLALLWTLLGVAGLLLIGPRVLSLLVMIREPMLLAFSTASSEAAYPKTLEQLQKWGVSRRIGSFVLPLGYSFNLDGSMMYCAFAVVFICQAYGVRLEPGEQLSMLLLLLITSKGMAAVPRGSLVVVAATLSHFGLPEAGLALVLAIDHVLDMGRSATNVVGNSLAAAVIARLEGEIRPPDAP